MHDDLSWVMSYSRWKDEHYWPAFRDALMRVHPRLTEESLLKTKEFNHQRYYYQTPLKQFVVAHDNIVNHCRTIHAMITHKARSATRRHCHHG